MQIDYHKIQRALLLNESVELTAEQCLSKLYENLCEMQGKSIKERHLINHSKTLVKVAKTRIRLLTEKIRTLEESDNA